MALQLDERWSFPGSPPGTEPVPARESDESALPQRWARLTAFLETNALALAFTHSALTGLPLPAEVFDHLT